MDRLRDVEAAVRFISAEPLLGPLGQLHLTGIAWVIVGGRRTGVQSEPLSHTEPMAPPKSQAIAWVRELGNLSTRTGVAFFFCSGAVGRPEPGGRQFDGVEWSQYPVAV